MLINILDHRNLLPIGAVDCSVLNESCLKHLIFKRNHFITFQYPSLHWFEIGSLQLVLWCLPKDSKMLGNKTVLKTKPEPFILYKRKLIKVTTGTLKNIIPF